MDEVCQWFGEFNEGPLHAEDLMQRVQGHEGDDGGAIGIGNDALVLGDIAWVNLGDDKWNGLVHAESAGIVDNHTASIGRGGSELFADAAARAKEGDVDAGKGVLLQLANSDRFPFEPNTLSGGASRSKRQ